MPTIKFIDHDSLLNWLEDLGVQHYLCGQCQGVHITEVQSQVGVLESRLFLEQDCLIFTTEVDIRNSAVLAVNAELPRFNGTYANLKFFLDVSDDGPARLIICDTQWVSAGITRDQFGVFLRAAVDAKVDVLRDLVDCRFIDSPENRQEMPSEPSLH
ncbi:YbjN domain-containing protein [Hahella sp. CCB-MM4]|uniref:YbjN domain-containing protein n=1 Tax=Hahella sp. (strain CCB-MM4) TaxID=1926491 RepID=UPI000B9C0ACB|nr:YbjN domain-containing protein [Hahella sp. CCB-MM4]OZG73529.1 YbjN domain-containing protein [Hahella sp. CCB-MM4]